MKHLLLLFTTVLLFCIQSLAQNVGINEDGTTPDNSAMLHIKSSNKGLLIPKIALDGAYDITTIPNPAISLLVYNTTSSTDLTPGYYYWSGAFWTELTTAVANGSETKITAGTNVTVTGTGTSASPYVVGVTNGTAPGQMQYWNGSAWITVATGQTGQILRFVNGIPTWVNDDLIYSLNIGDRYQGGIIAFFLESSDPGYDANVRHGIIVAPTDQNQTYWSNYVTSTGATGTAIGTGNANTIAIVNTHGTANAAGECFDLVLGGFSDWYLPSINELSRICINRAAIGGFQADYYWTSSEQVYDNSLVYVRDLGACNPELVSKTDSYRVRAVRSF